MSIRPDLQWVVEAIDHLLAVTNYLLVDRTESWSHPWLCRPRN